MENFMNKTHQDYCRTKEWALYRLKAYSKEMPNGCIEWQRAKSKQGYGIMTVTLEGDKTRVYYTHRLIWMLANDAELGRKIYVCHKCDNPSCINLNHLFVGMAKDNQQDMSRKGRSCRGRKRPEEHRGFGIKKKLHTRVRKFTNEEILEIKNAPGKVKDVAWVYGVSAGYVSRLKSGKAKSLV
jgi:hypothetical protein